MRDNLTTPLPVDGHAPYANWRNNTEQQSEEASLYNNHLVFLLCGDRPSQLQRYQDCCRQRETSLLNRRIQHCWSRLRQLQSACYGILYSSRLILLYNNHLEGRQTVENHIVHTGTSSYVQKNWCHQFPSYFLFSQFIFSWKQVCPWKLWKFLPSKNFLLVEVN